MKRFREMLKSVDSGTKNAQFPQFWASGFSLNTENVPTLLTF